MVVTCPSCAKKYRLEEKHFQGKDLFRFACPACKQVIEAVRPASAEATSAPPPPPPPPPTQKIKRGEETGSLSQAMGYEGAFIMPEGKRISLAVLQGADAGQIFPIEKPVFTMGRSDADLVLNDSEVSRLHAQIEIAGNAIVLKDLKSTNGTYVNEQRISVTPLEHQSEFRVGTTTLMLIVTDELS